MGYIDIRDREMTAADAERGTSERQTIVWKMQKYLYDHRPYLWLANDDSVSALGPGWVGFTNTPQGPFNELNIQSLTQVHQK